MGSSLLLEPSLGAPVDIADDLGNGLLELLAWRQLRGRERDALGVLAGKIHGCNRGAADSRAGGSRSAGVAVGAIGVGRDGNGLLAPGGDRSLRARLDGTESREGLLRLGVEGRLLGGRGWLLGLLLASSLLAQRGIGRGRLGRGGG